MPSLGRDVSLDPRVKIAVVLCAALSTAAFFAVAVPNGDADGSAQSSPLSSVEFLRVSGLKKHGTTDSAQWFATAETARTVAQKLGPFRFAPLRTHELTGLRVTVELRAGSADAPVSLVETLAKMAASFGVGSQVSQLVADDLRILVVSPQKEPLGLLHADSATWTGARGSVRFRNVAWREPERADLYSRVARLDAGSQHLLSESWLEAGVATCSGLGHPVL